MSTTNNAAILAKLQQILDVAQDILESDEFDWYKKYDLIFSEKISRQAISLFRDSPVAFDYWDPDTSYEEDVTAFVSALGYHIEELRNYSLSGYTDDPLPSKLMNRYNAL